MRGSTIVLGLMFLSIGYLSKLFSFDVFMIPLIIIGIIFLIIGFVSPKSQISGAYRYKYR